MLKILFCVVAACVAMDTDAETNYFVVWNVGQGLWTTRVTRSSCLHIDTGGEGSHYPRSVEKVCRLKRQQFQITHLDKDHQNFLKRIKSHREVCGDENVVRIKSMPLCQQAIPQLRKIYSPRAIPTDNGHSHVYELGQTILIPGDSTVIEESQWALRLNPRIKVLVLGHHGSQTSTSDFLLTHMPALRMAIASARKKRYGHPHALVVQRLRRHGIALLRTEVWGSIGVEI